MAVDSLVKVFPRWKENYSKIKESEVFSDANYTIPNSNPKFIGTIQQRYRPRNGSPAKSFAEWIEKIDNEIGTKLIPVLKKLDMMYDGKVGIGYNLANISDFNSLIAQSQEYGVPVYLLKDDQINQSGSVLKNMIKNRDDFDIVFKELADKIISLTANHQ